MKTEIYLNYAVYNQNGIDYLAKVSRGYSASDAWMQSDEKYHQIAGRKFGGLFGDDGKVSFCDRGYIRRISSNEEFKRLYESSCLLFKQNLKLLNLLHSIRRETKFESVRDSFRASRNIDQFEMWGTEFMLKYPEIDPDNSEYDHWFVDCATKILNMK